MAFWKRSRWIVAAPLAVLLLIGLYAALGFWVLPRYARGKAVDYVAQELHKDLSLGEVRFNPFAFRLDVHDLAIRDRGGDGKPLLALKRLHADLQASSLWRGGYVFRQVLLDQPYARTLIRADGSLNLAELLPASKQQQTPSPQLQIADFRVVAGRVDFADHSRRLKPEKVLAPISFTLRDFRTSAQSGGFRLVAASQQGERFDWSGGLQLSPLASDGEFHIAGLRARSVYEFLSDVLPMELSAGSFDLGGRYSFAAAAQGGTQLDLTLGEARATGLALRAQGVGEDWVRLPKLALENTRLSLAKRSLQIDAARVEGLKADIRRERDGSFNLARLFAPGAPAAAPTPSAASATPAPPTATTAADSVSWQFELRRLALEHGEVAFEDRGTQPAAKFRLAPLGLDVGDISLDTSRALPIGLQATLNGKAPLRLQGNVMPDTVAADLQIELGQLPLHELMPYLPQFPALQLKSGDVEAKGRLVLRPDDAPGPSLSFDGDGSVSDFDLSERAGSRDFLSWHRLDAQGVAYTQAPDALSIRQVRVRRPEARVIVAEDQTLNLVTMFSTPTPSQAADSGNEAVAAPGPAAAPATDAASPPAMPLKLGRLQLEDGVMGFADYSIDPNFAARIEALGGSITGLSTATDSVADIDLKGHILNQYSPVTISGGTRPFAYDQHTDVRMSFSNIDLPIFNPYSGRFAGYAIAKGKLSTDLHYRIEDRRLQAEHHLVLDQLEWGPATDSQDKVSLPVRLATSLLKDRHGVIDLKLPVNGTLDDPRFRVGPVVWQIVRNLLTKAVTAPFSFLGSLFKGAEEAQFVDFAAGSSGLSEASRTQLATLAKGLAERPALRLDIPAGTLAGLDPDALAAQRLLQALAGLSKEDQAPASLEALPPEQQVELLTRLYRKEFGARPELPDTAEGAASGEQAPAEEASRKEKRAQREQADAAWLRTALLGRYQPPAAELEALGRARANAIQDALLAGGELEPTRVFVSAGKAPVAHEGAVRLELGLE